MAQSHRAPAGKTCATFGIKFAENKEKFFAKHLDRTGSEGIYTRPTSQRCLENLERTEMLDFLLGILLPLKLLLLAWAAWHLLHWLL